MMGVVGFVAGAVVGAGPTALVGAEPMVVVAAGAVMGALWAWRAGRQGVGFLGLRRVDGGAGANEAAGNR